MTTRRLQILVLMAAVLTGILLLASCGSSANAPNALPADSTNAAVKDTAKDAPSPQGIESKTEVGLVSSDRVKEDELEISLTAPAQIEEDDSDITLTSRAQVIIAEPEITATEGTDQHSAHEEVPTVGGEYKSASLTVADTEPEQTGTSTTSVAYPKKNTTEIPEYGLNQEADLGSQTAAVATESGPAESIGQEDTTPIFAESAPTPENLAALPAPTPVPAIENQASMLPIGGQVGNQAPEFQSIKTWINSDPLSMRGLRGQVVLVDFWTYSCINCIRTLPYVKQWHEDYAEHGLVVVGVHAPEFQFERDTDNLIEAANGFELEYAIAQDNDFATWRAFNNRYWPAKYLIDQHGVVRYAHFGEGAYDQTEQQIRKLLEETGISLSN